MSIYRNGTLEGSFTITSFATFGLAGSGNFIGAGDSSNAYTGGNDRWGFNGTIDNVRIWNRTLSSSEIKTYYYNWVGNLTTTGPEEQPPGITVHSLECYVNNSVWENCSLMTAFNSNFTKIRANVTDDIGAIGWVNFTVCEVYDDVCRFSDMNFTSIEGGYYVYDNIDQVIDDSGDWNASVIAGNSTHNSEITQTWSVPWGWLDVDIITPTTNISVVQNNTFNLTAKVTCMGGECASEGETLKLWADPSGKIKAERITKNNNRIEVRVGEKATNDDFDLIKMIVRYLENIIKNIKRLLGHEN